MDTQIEISTQAAKPARRDALTALAVVLDAPERLSLRTLPLDAPGEGDVVVEMLWSGISTGTERLLWTGAMPAFPGMGYPLVPGYESVGEVVRAGAASGLRVGDRVFVPGARCYGEVRGLFGGAASRAVVAGERLRAVPAELGEQAVLLALAATARHALAASAPDLIVGHGVLGRLLARLACALGAEPPTVWETDAGRRQGARGYAVVAPETDQRRDYRCICDVSGDATLLDALISRIAPGGEVVLAGFYSERVSFAFPPAFMREARIRVAAEWQPADLDAVISLVRDGRLGLDGLITHRYCASEAQSAYRTAFGDPDCLKMLLDWRNPA
jgi:bacteriochlorophyllide a dehydrogenase